MDAVAMDASWSVDDLGWICHWGGQGLLQWEYAGFRENDPEVLAFVDHWLWKEAFHVHFSDMHLHTEDPMRFFLFDLDVQEVRARSDRARELGLSFASPP
jgi:hypothetical protein